MLLWSGAAVAVLGGEERELEEAHGLLCAALLLRVEERAEKEGGDYVSVTPKVLITCH